jgi:hypothetical protein
MSARTVARPWYREPWPWLLMVPPLGAVLGGFTMLALAIGTPEPLVVDDYAAIEDTTRAQFAADSRAAELHLQASVSIAVESSGLARVTVELAGDASFVAPHEINLRMRHVARADADRTAALVRANGKYAGEVQLANGRYALEISAADASWRLAGRVATLPAVLDLEAGL